MRRARQLCRAREACRAPGVRGAIEGSGGCKSWRVAFLALRDVFLQGVGCAWGYGPREGCRQQVLHLHGGHDASDHQVWVPPGCAASVGQCKGMQRAARAGGTGASCTRARGLCMSPCCSQCRRATSGALRLLSAPGPAPQLPVALVLASPSFLWATTCPRIKASCVCPHLGKAPAPFCASCPQSMGHFTHFTLPGGAESPSLGILGQRVSRTPETGVVGAGRSTGHFCSRCIAVDVHKGQAGLGCGRGREQAGSSPWGQPDWAICSLSPSLAGPVSPHRSLPPHLAALIISRLMGKDLPAVFHDSIGLR